MCEERDTWVNMHLGEMYKKAEKKLKKMEGNVLRRIKEFL